MDLDQYYTPPAVADVLVEATGCHSMRTCVDSACGPGSLLRAAQSAFADVHCIGLDKDSRVIRRLATSEPDWTVGQGDLFHPNRWKSNGVLERGVGCDAVIINPPFSMGRHPFRMAEWRGEMLRCSAAMAHLLATLRVFSPKQGGAAIVPESLMHSELDQHARNALSANYRLIPVTELRNTTFRGARANALILSIQPVTLERGPTCLSKDSKPHAQPEVTLVRGGLPVHHARNSRTGLSYVHSTDLRALAECGVDALKRRVKPISRGRVKGIAILLPRVGLPTRKAFVPVEFREPIQLSDCVLAIKADGIAQARRFSRSALEHWEDLERCYRGTGARYTTVSRILDWLAIIDSAKR